MPRYFFDTRDGGLKVKDDDGIELRDEQAARIEAIKILAEMVRDEMPEGDDQSYVCSIRDAAGRTMSVATLLFQLRRLTGPDASN